MKPVVGITMGDPAGIGPEIILKSLNDKDIFRICHPIVIGSFDILSRYHKNLEESNSIGKMNLAKVDSILQLEEYKNLSYPNIIVYDDFKIDLSKISIGSIASESGEASVLYLKKVVKLIKDGVINGTCSAPVNKEAINLAGYHYNGQTEFFKELTKSKIVIPLIIIDNIRLFQLTSHISMKEMLFSLSTNKILNFINFTNNSLKNIGIQKPKISIAGINPHAGENGLLGTEEKEIIEPAVSKAQNLGIDIHGPFPVDSLFIRVKNGEFDSVITIYHDQATIAMKLLGTPVTMTLGLPFIRTSVGHGTAYDIAGKNIADESVFKKSLKICAESINKIKG